MREIKFRAWIPETEELTFDCFGMDNLGKFWQYAGHGYYFNNHDQEPEFILMQYTGLKDKNGVEIYEGDVIRGMKDGEFYVWQVAFDIDRDFNGWSVTPQDAIHGEVIGNIYENKDLIE